MTKLEDPPTVAEPPHFTESGIVIYWLCLIGLYFSALRASASLLIKWEVYNKNIVGSKCVNTHSAYKNIQ